MIFRYGQGWVPQEEAEDGTQGGAGGGGDGSGVAPDDGVIVEDAGTGNEGDGVAPGDKTGAGAAPKDGEPKDMLDAITKGLEKTAPKVDDEAKKAADAAAAAQEKHPNGAAKKNEKGEDLDPEGKVVQKQAPKAKTSAELALSKEQLAALRPESRARFQEVITTLKARETEIATLTGQIKPLTEARDSIMSVLEETKTTADQLSAYLEFNRLLQSNDPKDIEDALQIVERQRVALYKALGREPEGGDLDLLADFPDLQGDVAESRLTRERALELANGRREKAANEQRSQRQNAQHQTLEQRKQVADKAVKDIEAWTAGLGKSDIDFKAKEKDLLDQVDEVFKTYAPEKWLDTLKLLYKGIKVTKQAAQQTLRGEQPLRPSGAKPGAKAPQDMYEAMWGTGKG